MMAREETHGVGTNAAALPVNSASHTHNTEAVISPATRPHAADREPGLGARTAGQRFRAVSKSLELQTFHKAFAFVLKCGAIEDVRLPRTAGPTRRESTWSAGAERPGRMGRRGGRGCPRASPVPSSVDGARKKLTGEKHMQCGGVARLSAESALAPLPSAVTPNCPGRKRCALVRTWTRFGRAAP